MRVTVIIKLCSGQERPTDRLLELAAACSAVPTDPLLHKSAEEGSVSLACAVCLNLRGRVPVRRVRCRYGVNKLQFRADEPIADARPDTE